MFRVCSIIETHTEVYTMSHTRKHKSSGHKAHKSPPRHDHKKKRRHHRQESQAAPSVTEIVSKQEKVLSESDSTFFHGVRSQHAGVNQSVNLNVNVQPADNGNGIGDCFGKIFKCFK